MSCRVNNIKEFLYLIMITAYLSAIFLTNDTVLKTNTAILNVLEYVRYFCYFLAVIKILLDWYNAKSICKIFIVVILVVLTVVNLNGNNYFFYVLMIIAAKDVDFRKIIRQACWVLGIGLLGIVSAAQMGWIENFLFLQEGRNRYSLGFTYTTYAPIFFFFFMMGYIYLRKERMRIYEFAVLEAINYWFYVMTETRFSFYLSTIMLVYVFIMRYYWENRSDQIKKNKWLMIAPPVCCVGSILMHVYFNPDNSAWDALNEFLNHRLSIGQNAFDTYGVTLFGQNITWMGHSKIVTVVDYNYVDCSYMQILLECGIVFLILVIAAYTYMMYVSIRTKDFYLQTVLLFIVVFSITEPRLFNLSFNPFPLLVAAAWSIKSPEELSRKEPISVPPYTLRAVQIRLKNRC